MKRAAIRITVLVGVLTPFLFAIAWGKSKPAKHVALTDFSESAGDESSASPSRDPFQDDAGSEAEAPAPARSRFESGPAEDVPAENVDAADAPRATWSDADRSAESDTATTDRAPAERFVRSSAHEEESEPRRLEARDDEPAPVRSTDPFDPRTAVSDDDDAPPSNVLRHPQAGTRPARTRQAEETDRFERKKADGSGFDDRRAESATADNLFREEKQGTTFTGQGQRLTTATSPSEGNGKPGASHLEGAQAPHLTIEKSAPAEIQVGKAAIFLIKVRNSGEKAAQNVEIHDVVPKGTRLVNTTPQANEGAEGDLVWGVGALKPGGEATVQMEVMPTAEGEIGSVATVHFRAEASAKSVCTRPDLALQVIGPQKAMIGGPVNLKIKISNPGSGVATGVIITEKIPPGLRHSAGPELEFEVGSLKPGEMRELDLPLTAAEAGQITNTLTAVADASLKVEEHTEIEVVAPGLKVALVGPKKRYLERNATYNISVSNPGTAPAKDVELMTALPKGMKFVSANNSGQYDAATHTVYWSLAELPPNETGNVTGNVTLTVLPIETGDLKMQIKGRAEQGLADEHNETIAVEGLAALQFQLVDSNDPIEVNGETTYEIHVTNQGSKAATSVRVAAMLPDEMKAISAAGPVKHSIDGQRIVFEPLGQLAPKADTTFSIKAKGMTAGDLRIRVQLMSAEITTPITKEESTRVYSDEE